jgi:hypothetical protein
MKSVTTREFYHTPVLVDAVHFGQSLIVKDNGESKFIVTKVGQRPRKTRADLERDAREICPKASPKVNFTEVLTKMKAK